MTDLEQYPHLFPPASARPFDRNKPVLLAPNTTLAAGGALLETIQPMQSYEGVLRFVDIFSANFGSSTTLVSCFQFRLGGTPITDYTIIQMPLVPEIPLIIKIPANTPFTLYGFNQTGGAIAARYRLCGWFYPVA